MKDFNIIVNDFVKRQTATSRFSHFNGTWRELVVLVMENWNIQSPGYRDGVIFGASSAGKIFLFGGGFEGWR